MLHTAESVRDDLSSLLPIRLFDARKDGYYNKLFNYFLHHYHYLGFNTIVGENLRYIAIDRHQPSGLFAVWRACLEA